MPSTVLNALHVLIDTIPTAALRPSYSTSQLKELRLERLTHLPKVSQLVKGQVGSVERVYSGGKRGGLEAKPGEGGADGRQQAMYITPPGLVTLAGICAGRSYVSAQTWK